MSARSRQGTLALLVAIGALLCLLAGPADSAFAATITVTSAADGAPANDGVCTLREAISNANNNNQVASIDCAAGEALPIVDVIAFNIGGGGPQTIAPVSNLPDVTQA